MEHRGKQLLSTLFSLVLVLEIMFGTSVTAWAESDPQESRKYKGQSKGCKEKIIYNKRKALVVDTGAFEFKTIG